MTEAAIVLLHHNESLAFQMRLNPSGFEIREGRTGEVAFQTRLPLPDLRAGHSHLGSLAFQMRVIGTKVGVAFEMRPFDTEIGFQIRFNPSGFEIREERTGGHHG